MAIQTQNSKLNVVPGGIIPVVNVSQHDVGRTLTFTLMDGNGAASLASGTTATIEGQKPSRKGFAYAAAINGNVVTINTVFQMTVEAGTVECKIRLKNGNQDVGTALFLMEVEKTGVTDGVDVSETVLPVYMEAGRQYMLGAEAWAKGTRNGVPVSSGDPEYHNNSKYWSEISAENGEAWAVGTRNGTPVSSSDPAYHNNSKYHSEQSEIHEHNSEAWAVGERSHIPVENIDETYHNNSKYYAGISADKATESEYWSNKSEEYADEVGEALNSISAIVSIIKTLFGKIYLVTQGGDYLITQDGDRLIISY